MSSAPTISVVIPVYNEASFLETAIADLRASLDGVDADVSVLLAENGSTDATPELATRLSHEWEQLEWLHIDTPDYGGAMREGFLASKGDWVVNFDIDYTSAEFLQQVVELGDGVDVILASKRAAGSEDRRSPLRRLATWGFNLLLRLLLGSGVSDTHGIKAVRRHVVDELAPLVISRKDLFDTELVIRAEKAGHRILEVPVIVEEMREARSSLFKRIPRTLLGVWRIRTQLSSERRAGS